jgi:hypothetical protein
MEFRRELCQLLMSVEWTLNPPSQQQQTLMLKPHETWIFTYPQRLVSDFSSSHFASIVLARDTSGHSLAFSGKKSQALLFAQAVLQIAANR